MIDIYERITVLLQKAMQEKGFNVTQLADASGIEKGNVSTYVSGKRKPSIDTLLKFANAMNVDVSEFIYIKPEIKDNTFICSECGTVYELKRKEKTK